MTFDIKLYLGRRGFLLEFMTHSPYVFFGRSFGDPQIGVSFVLWRGIAAAWINSGNAKCKPVSSATA